MKWSVAGKRTAGICALGALLVTSCGRLGFEDIKTEDGWSFVDDEEADFDLGDYGGGSAQLDWDGEAVGFSAAPPYASSDEGVFVSALFDTGDATAVWETLAWIPSAPDGRPLPDNGGADSGYQTRSISMADNILLLHLDDQGVLQDDQVVDSSGMAHHGSVVLDGQAVSTVEGAYGGAFDLDRDAWVRLDGSFFDFGTSDFTYSIWVKMRDCAASNDNRIAIGGAGSNDRPHMWLGASCPAKCSGGDDAHMNFLDDSRMGPSLETCTGVVLGDGKWHHMAAVKRGHTAPPALVQLFVDGREVDATAYDFGTATFSYDGGEIRLGSFNLDDPTYNTSIVVDEAAIWKRALDDAEIQSLYHRGAVDLALQVRVCGESGCGSEAFVGPDGTSATYFTEADLSGPAGSQAGNLVGLGLIGPKAQYRARFATSAESVSPGLRYVRLEAQKTSP